MTVIDALSRSWRQCLLERAFVPGGVHYALLDARSRSQLSLFGPLRSVCGWPLCHVVGHAHAHGLSAVSCVCVCVRVWAAFACTAPVVHPAFLIERVLSAL